MANHRNRFPARRRFLKQSTALTATVVALPLPRLAGAAQKRSDGDATSTAVTSQAPRRRRRPSQ
jgi:hypothetical protein